jgi:ubiquinone/menaquinone biosynthesis C-methylase UbiE
MFDSTESSKSTQNFNTIAVEEYDNSIATHVMRHLTQRRVDVISQAAATGKVLDVGCGTGTLLNALPKDRYERHGIDLSEGMVSEALAKDSTLHAITGSATDIPYPDNTFDVVICAAVLHHIVEPDLIVKTIKEMVRVTKPGGTAIVWDHNPSNPYWPIIMRRVPQDIGEERLIPKKEIQAALDSIQPPYKLQIKWRQMTFIPDFAPKWSMKILSVFERFFEQVPFVNKISAHNVAIVKKYPGSEGE